MEVIISPNFISILKGKHLLLDANVFVDASLKPTQFLKLFSQLKEDDITLVTINEIKAEFLKGSANSKVFKEKIEFIESIIDTYLPITEKTNECLDTLIHLLGQDGAGCSVPDLLLGAMLIQYGSNLALLSRNTRDFPTNIFSVNGILNFIGLKSIHSYGVYTFKK